jgi:hypothetical protein
VAVTLELVRKGLKVLLVVGGDCDLKLEPPPTSGAPSRLLSAPSRKSAIEDASLFGRSNVVTDPVCFEECPLLADWLVLETLLLDFSEKVEGFVAVGVVCDLSLMLVLEVPRLVVADVINMISAISS